jgi:hypothetical protein
MTIPSAASPRILLFPQRGPPRHSLGAALEWVMARYRLLPRALDHLDHVITYARLRILDWMYEPEPPTPADQQRERD